MEDGEMNTIEEAKRDTDKKTTTPTTRRNNKGTGDGVKRARMLG